MSHIFYLSNYINFNIPAIIFAKKPVPKSYLCYNYTIHKLQHDKTTTLSKNNGKNCYIFLDKRTFVLYNYSINKG